MIILAEARNYTEFMGALRARADQLQVARTGIDDLMKTLPDGYASKLLSAVPVKNLGPISMGPLLGALGLKVLVVEDVEAMAQITRKMVKRNASQVRDASDGMLPPKKRRRKAFWKNNTGWAHVMNSRRALILSESKRSEIARTAARFRWKRKGKKTVPLDGDMVAVTVVQKLPVKASYATLSQAKPDAVSTG